MCCLKDDCIHPLCKSQTVSQLPTWYVGGPSISFVPLPIPDEERPWGQCNCRQCKGTCYGHYLKPTETISSSASPAVPPSLYIKEKFEKLVKYPASEEECESVARQGLLSPEQVMFWFDHLHTVSENRKRGAAQAAITRQRNKQEKTTT